MTDRDYSPGEIVGRLERYREVAAEVQAGLRGRRFRWGLAEGEHNVCRAADLGITLLTETQIAGRGYRLKQRARPVGHRHFGAPIGRSAALYVLECQCVKVESAGENRAGSVTPVP